MTKPLRRLGFALLSAFAATALALGYWGMVRQPDLLQREQNPRRVLEEQRRRRGQILDRDEVVLAATITDPDTGLSRRRYPYPSAAPVVGYYSLRYGVGGIEARYDDTLRGDRFLPRSRQILRQVLHQPQIGGDVRLTLDYRVQMAAARALANRPGSIVVVSIPDGEVLALASYPTFDPGTLDASWEALSADPGAPLVNRATQGLYQPGSILQSVLLAAALESGLTPPVLEPGTEGSIRHEGATLPCAGVPPRTGEVSSAFLWACPAPFIDLAARTGERSLSSTLRSFGLLEAPSFILPVEAVDLTDLSVVEDLPATAVGQGALRVTPLHMAQVAAAFANRGEIPALRLVDAVRAPGGSWQSVAPQGHPRGTVSPATVSAVAELMRQTVQGGAAQAAALPGAEVHGHAGLAISGPEGALNAWFIGFAPLPRGGAVAVVVLIESESSAAAAAQAAGDTLRAVIVTR